MSLPHPYTYSSDTNNLINNYVPSQPLASGPNMNGLQSTLTYTFLPHSLWSKKQLLSLPFYQSLNRLNPLQRKQLIQESLTAKIKALRPNLANHVQSQIGNMLVASHKNELILVQLLHDEQALRDKIDEALVVLKSSTRHRDQDEQEEYEAKYHVLKANLAVIHDENQRLKLQLKYSKWKWYDVWQWIMQLNQKQFVKYDQRLYDNLKKHCIDGSMMAQLTEQHWQMLGITDYNLICVLMEAIEGLYVPQIDNSDDIGNTSNQAIICAKTAEYDRLEKEYNALVLRYCKLDDEHVKLQQTTKHMDKREKDDRRQNKERDDGDDDAKNDEVQTATKMNYTKWDSQQVYAWMTSLKDGYFVRKYKSLFDNIQNENIDGSCLCVLDRGDAHRIGITDFKDKVLFMDLKEKLINSQ